MLTPEITYRYTLPKDVAGPTFEIFHQTENTTAAAAQIFRRASGIPKDRILIVSNIILHADPGATQACIELSARAFTQAGIAFQVDQLDFAVVADLNHNLSWQGELWLPGRGGVANMLEFRATFDAGVNANVLETCLQGVLIPRGNVGAF